MASISPAQKQSFHQVLGELKQKLLSHHDVKMKKEELISKDYLEYLALKYTSQSFAVISDNYDTAAIRTILSHL